MSRKPRITSSTDIYHVVLRSINKHIIFEEEEDYQKCLRILSDCKKNTVIDIYAYCLMDNHIHLLVHASPEALSAFFQGFGSRFVRWYNRKYSRSGHLFQERFYSVAVESEEQYLSTLVYIHNNPVKANICRFPAEYLWSSYNVFYGRRNALINQDASYKIAGSRELLQQYFATQSNAPEVPYSAAMHPQTKQFLADQNALSIFKEITNLASTAEVINLTKPVRNQYIRELRQRGLTHKQVARIMDVSISTVKRILKE